MTDYVGESEATHSTWEGLKGSVARWRSYATLETKERQEWTGEGAPRVFLQIELLQSRNLRSADASAEERSHAAIMRAIRE